MRHGTARGALRRRAATAVAAHPSGQTVNGTNYYRWLLALFRGYGSLECANICKYQNLVRLGAILFSPSASHGLRQRKPVRDRRSGSGLVGQIGRPRTLSRSRSSTRTSSRVRKWLRRTDQAQISPQDAGFVRNSQALVRDLTTARQRSPGMCSSVHCSKRSGIITPLHLRHHNVDQHVDMRPSNLRSLSIRTAFCTPYLR